MPSSRRAFLAGCSIAVLSAVSGCSGSSTTPLDVDVIEIRQSFEWLLASAHWQGVTLTDQQLVFLHIPDSAGVQGPTDVHLVVGERTFETAEKIAGVDRNAIDWGHAFEGGVQAAYSLPLDIDAEAISVTASGVGEYEIPESMVGRLRDPPDLEVLAFRIIETTEETVTVSIEIENAGGSPATFRANLGPTALSGLGRIDIQVAARTTETVEPELNRFGTDESETYRFDWGTGSRTVTVGSD